MLMAASGGAAGLLLHRSAVADNRPAVTKPRATSGDVASEPNWDERLTVTVGPEKADIVGTTDQALQAAIGYVARLGGGTVQVLPGVYALRNSLFLTKGVRLLGSGDESVLRKEASHETGIAADSDWFDQEITLENAEGFKVGDGVILETKNPHHGGLDVMRRTLVARSGNRFKLDRALRNNFWQDMAPTVSSRFPMITAEETGGFAVEHLTLDGNRANNAHINGNYAGGLWFQDCRDIVMKNLHVHDYNGDGISFQISHDVVVQGCRVDNNKDLGIHPGSGAQRPLMTDNVATGNNIGIFFCWGVKYGLAERNRIEDNNIGISIGHRDDENVIQDNDVLRSALVGVTFRPERGKGYTAKGNRVENNRITDSGDDDGVAIDVQGVTANNSLVGNALRETRGPASRIGIRLGESVGDMQLAENAITGFATPIADLRAG
jgi:hypothetical protein